MEEKLKEEQEGKKDKDKWTLVVWNKRKSLFLLIPFFLIVLFYLMFREGLIENTEFIRDSFLWSLNESLAADFFFLLFLSLLIHYVYKDKLSRNFIFNALKWCIFFSFIYSYERFYVQEWTYTKSFTFSRLLYLDIIYVLALLFIGKLIHKWINNRKEIKYEATFFNEDLPISGDKDEDYLGYFDYAKEVHDKLSIGNFKKSFAVGVCGPWGAGKTSFINLLKKQFQKSDDNIWVEFSPWNAEGEIRDEFFSVVEQSVYKKNENLARLIHTYSSSLNDFVENGVWQKLNSRIENNLTGRTKNDLIETIGNQLIRSNKKLIIVIDDIDRLVEEEILEILQIIRNTGDFKNTIYLVAYDKEYLSSILKTKFPDGRIEYSDKVFQLEVTLPQIEEALILRKLVELIKSKEERLEPILEQIISNNDGYGEEVLRHLKTPRDIIKVVNSLVLNFQQLPEDLNVKDLLFIEILKLRDTKLYYSIYNRKSDILKYFKENENGKGEIYFQLKEDSTKFVSAYSSTNDEAQINDLSELLLKLLKTSHFGLVKNSYKKSICIPSQFATYFSLNLSSEKVSNAEIARLRNLSYEEMITEVRKFKIGQPRWSDFLQKVYSIDSFDSTEDFKSIIRLKLLYAHNMPSETRSIINNIRAVRHEKAFFENDQAIAEFIYGELNVAQFDRNERLKIAHLIVHDDNLKNLLKEDKFNAIQIRVIDEQFAKGARTDVVLDFQVRLLFVEREKCDFTFPKLPKTTKNAMTIETAQHLKSKLIDWDLNRFLELLIINGDPNDKTRFKLGLVEQFYSSIHELQNDKTLEIDGKTRELDEFKDFIKKLGSTPNGISYPFQRLNPNNMRL